MKLSFETPFRSGKGIVIIGSVALVLAVGVYFGYQASGLRAVLLGIRAEKGPVATADLVNELHDKSLRKVTVNYLALYGLAALPALNEALANSPSPATREGAAISLSRMCIVHPEVVPNLKKEAIPVLSRSLMDNDSRVRVHSANAIWNIEHNADQILSVLMELTKDPNEHVRYHAFLGLEEMGPSAREAIPTLVEARASGDSNTQVWAQRAVNNIARSEH